MKKCLQCQQLYGDDTNFCLADGSTLVSVSDSFISTSDAPTIVGNFPATLPPSSELPAEIPTVLRSFRYTPPPTSETPAETQMAINNLPFTPPVSYTNAPLPEPKKSNTLLIAVMVGFFALVVGGAVVGLVMYGLNSSDNKDTNTAGDKSNKNSADQKSVNDKLAQNLKQQQEKLDTDQQKLEDERKALEAKKKQAAQTPRPSNATTATIIDPPSNIRASPNGAVICVMRQRGTVVNILGPTGVSDTNGTWYYTDACGRTGVIHSSQIRF